MMKKWLIGGSVVGIAVYLGAVGYIHQADKARSESLVIAAATQEQAIHNLLIEKGCDYCHTNSAAMPFYASVPGFKQMMDYDVQLGMKHFSLTPTLNALKEGKAAAEVDLAKIESSIMLEQMPPPRFGMAHWAAGIDPAERIQILDWVKAQRLRYYATQSGSGEMSTAVLQPLPDSLPFDKNKAALGFTLYHDTRLSSDNTISCASCHLLDKGGVDNAATSTGVGGQKGGINAPTVFNAVFNIEQFWDGRAVDLQAQAGGPPLNPVEMASTSWEQIIDKLQQDPQLTQAFVQVYPEGYSDRTITDAIAEFEKTLITPNSPFDRYLKGEQTALTAQQINGYRLFTDNKCGTCHAGKNIGGQSYDLMGLKADYFAERQRDITADDLGRINVTQEPRDKHRFKTPGLRNVALTAPYFHDAQAETLQQAVALMLKYQVGTALPESEVNDIAAFLESLTGEYYPQFQ